MLNRVQQEMVEDLQKAKKIINSILKMVGEENFNNDVIKNAKQFCDKI
jgi:ubiquinone biosynthesis protein COQ9